MPRTTRPQSAAFIGPVLGVVAVALTVAYQAIHITGYAYGQAVYSVDDYDEGVYMATGALMAHGYHLFTQIYSAQPPLFPALLAAFDTLFGVEISSARVLLLVCGVVTLLAVAAIGALTVSRIAGGTAALLLAISPEFLVYAHAIEEEIPMTALATVALALAFVWYRRRSPYAAVASGLMLGLAVLVKFYALALLAPLAVLLAIVAWDEWHAAGPAERAKWLLAPVRDACLWMVAAALPLLVSLLIFGGAEWQQMVGDRLAASREFPGPQSTSGNVHMILSFMGADPGLYVLAVAGACLMLLTGWRLGLILDGWGAGLLLVLARYHPLMGHHPVILLAPAAVVAGIAVDMAVSGRQVIGLGTGAPGPGMQRVPRVLRPREPAGGAGAATEEPGMQPRADVIWPRGLAGGGEEGARKAAVFGGAVPAVRVVALLGVIAYLGLLPRLVASDNAVLVPHAPGVRAAAGAVVRAHTPPNGFMATGDAWIAVDAGRLIVPDMVDSSYVRIMTGKLTAREAIADTERYHASTVALWPRLRYLTAYAHWVERHYQLLRRFCGGAPAGDCDTVYGRR